MEDSFAPKKLALLRVFQIVEQYTDEDHQLTYEDIVDLLNKEYGIVVERKAVGRNLSLLKEAGYDIVTTTRGTYLAERTFENAELRLLIDSVLSDKFISAKHSADLIQKICGLGNRYFRKSVKNIYSVREWNKTDNMSVFYTIDIIDEAIDSGRQIMFYFNRYGADKRLHSVSKHISSPYLMILKNQNYYLMAYSERWHKVMYYRLDRITRISIIDAPATPIREIDGFHNGIDYKRFSTALPYMYNDDPQPVEFFCDEYLLDQVYDWFGKDVTVTVYKDRFKVYTRVSLHAMEYWAMQYLNAVEILAPQSLRDKLKENIRNASKKYEDGV